MQAVAAIGACRYSALYINVDICRMLKILARMIQTPYLMYYRFSVQPHKVINAHFGIENYYQPIHEGLALLTQTS